MLQLQNRRLISFKETLQIFLDICDACSNSKTEDSFRLTIIKRLKISTRFFKERCSHQVKCTALVTKRSTFVIYRATCCHRQITHLCFGNQIPVTQSALISQTLTTGSFDGVCC